MPRSNQQDDGGAGWFRNRALAEYLNVSEVTIWNWQRDQELNFPQPSVINGIPYTSVKAVNDWMKTRVVSRIVGAA